MLSPLLTLHPWVFFKVTNYVVIGGYFLLLMSVYLNILKCYELRSFSMKDEAAYRCKRGINDGEADFE